MDVNNNTPNKQALGLPFRPRHPPSKMPIRPCQSLAHASPQREGSQGLPRLRPCLRLPPDHPDRLAVLCLAPPGPRPAQRLPRVLSSGTHMVLSVLSPFPDQTPPPWRPPLQLLCSDWPRCALCLLHLIPPHHTDLPHNSMQSFVVCFPH